MSPAALLIKTSIQKPANATPTPLVGRHLENPNMRINFFGERNPLTTQDILKAWLFLKPRQKKANYDFRSFTNTVTSGSPPGPPNPKTSNPTHSVSQNQMFKFKAQHRKNLKAMTTKEFGKWPLISFASLLWSYQIEISTYIRWKNKLKSRWELWSLKHRCWFLVLPTKSQITNRAMRWFFLTEGTNWVTWASSKWEPNCRRFRNAHGSQVSFLSDDGRPYCIVSSRQSKCTS